MELKWKTPVPQLGNVEDERVFIERLVRWLREQEREKDFYLEEFLAFGGTDVASRIFGFEGRWSGYAALSERTILPAPSGSNKTVVVGLHISSAGTSGDFQLVKRKGTVDAEIMVLDTSVLTHEEVVGGHKTGYIVLDSTDESLVVKALTGATDAFSYSGSYIDVE